MAPLARSRKLQLREPANSASQSSEVNAMEEPLLLQHRDDRGVVTLMLNGRRPSTRCLRCLQSSGCPCR